jgi:hypothetical protein
VPSGRDGSMRASSIVRGALGLGPWRRPSQALQAVLYKAPTPLASPEPSHRRAETDVGQLGQIAPRGLPGFGVESDQGRGPLYIEVTSSDSCQSTVISNKAHSRLAGIVVNSDLGEGPLYIEVTSSDSCQSTGAYSRLAGIGVNSDRGERSPIHRGNEFSMPGHCHIEQGVVQLSKGGSALHRLAYQTCTYFNDGIRHGDYSRFAGDHLGGVILLPPGASPEFADECSFVMAVGFREVRRDAQAGRTIDFSLPRALSNELLLPVAAFALAPFVYRGMATRIDIECPPASDNDRNPHGHAYLAQRYLDASGFGNKARAWNALFLRNLGRYVRAVIAARVTLACALLGVAAYMDPRRNEVRGLPLPEERIPAPLWRMHERAIYVAPIEKLKGARQQRKAANGDLPGRPETSEGPETVLVRSAVYSRLVPGDEERQLSINFVVPLALAAQVEARGSASARAEIVLTTRGGSLTFDGEAFRVDGRAGPARAQLIVELAKALDWPALVVEGDSGSADEIIIAGVPLDLTAINLSASDHALLWIQKCYGHLLAEAIQPLDPRNVVGHLLKEKPDKFEQTDFASDMKATEDHRQIGALSDSGMVADQAFKTPENAGRTAFDLDMPEPKSNRAEEEEKLRQSGELLWETWLVARHNRLVDNSGREAREQRPPPKAPEKGPP